MTTLQTQIEAAEKAVRTAECEMHAADAGLFGAVGYMLSAEPHAQCKRLAAAHEVVVEAQERWRKAMKHLASLREEQRKGRVAA